MRKVRLPLLAIESLLKDFTERFYFLLRKLLIQGGVFRIFRTKLPSKLILRAALS